MQLFQTGNVMLRLQQSRKEIKIDETTYHDRTMWQDIASANPLIINTALVESCSEGINIMSVAQEKQCQHIRTGRCVSRAPENIQETWQRHKGTRTDSREKESWERLGVGNEKRKKKKCLILRLPTDRQWCSSPSVSLGWGSGALQRLWPT